MNPEFQRYIWQNLSAHRLLVMPLWIFICTLFAYLVFTDLKGEEYIITLALFSFITAFWGSNAAGESISEEIQNHTWDWQRMSSISPWQLTWGKIFGSTSYAWYAGIWCLLLFFILVPLSSLSIQLAIKIAIIMVLLAVLVHSLVFLINMLLILKQAETNKRYIAISLLIILILINLLLNMAEYQHEKIYWYGEYFYTINFF